MISEPMRNLVVEKLSRILGPDEAQVMVDKVLSEANLDSLNSPEDLLVFCKQLEVKAGFIRFIAQSLRAEAIILGASPSA